MKKHTLNVAKNTDGLYTRVHRRHTHTGHHVDVYWTEDIYQATILDIFSIRILKEYQYTQVKIIEEINRYEE